MATKTSKNTRKKFKKIIKKKIVGKKIIKKSNTKKKTAKKIAKKNIPSLKLRRESDIAMDFAIKTYKKFNKIIKSIILFGSTVKQNNVAGSDIDLIIILDDVSLKWDQELIAWYRTELEKILRQNPYNKSLHINTIKLSTWWQDLMRGDPVVLNILRHGKAIIDFAGFYTPLKQLLIEGKIKATPEAVYTALQRAPMHLRESRVAELNAIDGVYWSMVNSAHAALIAANIAPPSPEHIPTDLKLNFVDSKKLKMKYVIWYRDLLILHKKINHGEISDLKGVEIDDWQDKAEKFLDVMAGLVKDIVS